MSCDGVWVWVGGMRIREMIKIDVMTHCLLETRIMHDERFIFKKTQTGTVGLVIKQRWAVMPREFKNQATMLDVVNEMMWLGWHV